MVVTRKRAGKQTESQLKKAKIKKGHISAELNANEFSEPDTEQSETVQFHENQYLVEIEVHNSQTEFNSDGEQDSEYDEGEITHEEDCAESSFIEMDDNGHGSTNDETMPQTATSGAVRIKSKVVKVKNQDSGQQDQSIEAMGDKIEKLSDALLAMQYMMLKKGVFELQQETGRSVKLPGKNKQGNKVDKSSGSNSVTTFYQNAVEKVSEPRVIPQQLILRDDPEISFKAIHLRDSTSSENQVDTSNELIDIDLNNVVGGDDKARQPNEGGRQPTGRTAKDKGDDVLKEVEAAKARMYATPGEETSDMVDRFLNDFRFKQWDRQQCANHPSALVDENYLVMGVPPGSNHD